MASDYKKDGLFQSLYGLTKFPYLARAGELDISLV